MPDIIFTVLVYLAAWALLYILSRIFVWEKRGVTVEPLFLMIRTSRLNESLNSLSQKRVRIWRIIWNLGVVLAFGQMGFIIYFLSHNLLDLTTRAPQAAGMVLLIPGVTVSLETLPYIIVALAVVLITHEFAHAIASLVDGVSIKSVAVFFAVLIPGGACELDDEKLEKSRLATKLRVFAAGSSANIVAWGVVILLLANFALTISPLYHGPTGILVSGVVENGGSEKAGIRKWDVIYAINNQPIRNVAELGAFMLNVRPGTVLSLRTDRGSIDVTAQPNPQNLSRALLGVYPFNYFAPNLIFLPKDLPYHIYWSEYWTSALLVWIAIFNTLPLYPLDGDKIVHSLISSRSEAAAKYVRIALSIVFLTVLGLNLVLSYFNFGLVRI